MHWLNSDERMNNSWRCWKEFFGGCDGTVISYKTTHWKSEPDADKFINESFHLEGKCEKCHEIQWETVDAQQFNSGRQEYWDCRIDAKTALGGAQLKSRLSFVLTTL